MKFKTKSYEDGPPQGKTKIEGEGAQLFQYWL